MEWTIMERYRIVHERYLVHAKVPAGVFHEHVILDEGARVAQHLDPLPGCQFALKKIRKKFAQNLNVITIASRMICK